MKLKLLSLLFLLPAFAFAKQIDINTAMSVAGNFVNGKRTNTRSSAQLQLAYTATAKSAQLRSADETHNCYYVFNKGNNAGFIIIAADDAMPPVLGYTNSGSFPVAADRQPPAFRSWMAYLDDMMTYVVNNKPQPVDNASEQWAAYLSGNGIKTRGATAVQPLITSMWGQHNPFMYEGVTPNYDAQNQFVSGCEATAIAQIMRFHKWPAKGKKIIPAYTTNTRGYHFEEVDITQYNYKWNEMQDFYARYTTYTITQAEPVASLMFHCGAALRMDYSSSSVPSGTDIIDALIEYFDYDKDIRLVSQKGVPNEAWKNILKKEIDNNRPIAFSGIMASGAAHAFICDGYDDNSLFHFNFGWYGDASDGYYDVTQPKGYFYTQIATINIKKNEGGKGFNYISRNIASPANAEINRPFDVSFEAENRNNPEDKGTYFIALCTDANRPEIVANLGEATPGANTVSCLAGLDITPGRYRIRVADLKTYSLINNQETDPVITLTPEPEGDYVIRLTESKPIGTTRTRTVPGDIFDVEYSYSNTGSQDFEGEYGIVITDNNGKFLRTLNTQTGTIASGANLNSVTLTCQIPEDMPNGKYRLRMAIHRSAASGWVMVNGASQSVPDFANIEVRYGLEDDEELIEIYIKENDPYNESLSLGDKIYDGTKAAYVTTEGTWGKFRNKSNGSLIRNNNLFIKKSSFVGEYESPDVLNYNLGEVIKVKLLKPLELDGPDAHKYSLIQPESAYGNILKTPMVIRINSMLVPQGTDKTTITPMYTIHGLKNGETDDVLKEKPVILIKSVVNTNSTGVNTEAFYIDYDNYYNVTATNYTVDFEYGDIIVYDSAAVTPVSLSGLTVKNKVYDGTTAAEVESWGTLEGADPNDDVRIDQSVVFSFESENAGNGIKVNASKPFELTGTDASKYILVPYNDFISADISKAPVTIAAKETIIHQDQMPDVDDILQDRYEVSGFIDGEEITDIVLWADRGVKKGIAGRATTTTHTDAIKIAWSAYNHDVVTNNYDIEYVAADLKVESGGTVNIEDHAANGSSFVVYPNPVRRGQTLNIMLPQNSEVGVAGIHTASGIRVASAKIQRVQGEIAAPNEPGVYMLVYTAKDGAVKRTKIIVR